MKPTRAAFALALILAFAPVDRAAACPNCKEAVAEQTADEAQRLANGYSYSIMLLLSTPLILLGTGAVVVARLVKRGALPEL